jgi:hypothetical protein
MRALLGVSRGYGARFILRKRKSGLVRGRRWRTKEASPMTTHICGIDVGKTVFHLAGVCSRA